MMKELLLNHKRVLWSLLLCLFSAGASFAQQTTAFTYQGRLANGGTPVNGNYDFEFRLFDVVTGGTALATLQRNSVPVTTGVFTVQLDFGANFFDGSDRFLEIAVQMSGGSGFTTLAPRQKIASTPYSIRSIKAMMVDDNSITSNSILDDSILSNDIQNETITSADILDGTITSNEIMNGTIAGADIASNTITGNEIADDTITSADIMNDIITSDDIADDTITSADIMNDTITSADIANETISSDDIMNDTITSDDIADNSITSNDLATNSVGSSEVMDNSLTSADIMNDTITSDDIAANSITSNEIAGNAVGTNEVADNSLIANDLASNSVGSDEIAANAVSSSELDSNMALAVWSGRINGLSSFGGSDVFGSVTGISNATFVEDDVKTGTPNRICKAQSLAVRQTVASGSGNARIYILRVNGADTSIGCAISNLATTCATTPGVFVSITPLSEISFKVITSGTGLPTTSATTGVECR